MARVMDTSVSHPLSCIRVPLFLLYGVSPLSIALGVFLAVAWVCAPADVWVQHSQWWPGGESIDARRGCACCASRGENVTSPAAQYKRWVEAGVLQAALDYSAVRAPAFLGAGPPAACEKTADEVVIFILGDSVDREMVDCSCDGASGRLESWSDTFKYQAGVTADRVCITSLNSAIGHLNIYGSAPTGPYLHGHVNTEDDPFADTELRVRHGIDQFAAKFGDPSLVLFRADLWDLHVTGEAQGLDRAELFERYLRNMREVFAYVRRRLPRTIVGTHTVPTIKWGRTLFQQYQNAVRLLAREDDELVLFDFQLLTQDLPLEAYLRDTHHPKPEFLLSFFQIIHGSALRWIESCRHVL